MGRMCATREWKSEGVTDSESDNNDDELAHATWDKSEGGPRANVSSVMPVHPVFLLL